MACKTTAVEWAVEALLQAGMHLSNARERLEGAEHDLQLAERNYQKVKDDVDAMQSNSF